MVGGPVIETGPLVCPFCGSQRIFLWFGKVWECERCHKSHFRKCEGPEEVEEKRVVVPLRR